MSQAIKTHSIIGIVSCVIALGMFLLFLIAGIAYYIQFQQQAGSGSEDLALLQLLVEMFAPVPVHLVGLILGVIAMFFPNRKKLFPATGIALNLIFGLCSLFPWFWLIFKSMGRV